MPRSPKTHEKRSQQTEVTDVAEQIINLTRGVPPVEAFPTQELIRCAEASLRRDPDVLLQYGPSPGYTPLRQWLGRQHGVGAEQVLIGNSSLEIFAFITQTHLGPGTRVFLESPSYDRAIHLVRRAGAQVVGVPLEADGLNLDVLEDELRKGALAFVYIIPDFQNPVGVTTGLEKRQRLAALARQHSLWPVEDAPYRTLRYRGQELPSLRSLAPERVLHMSSFSKILSPGLRLGYLVGPAETVADLARWAVGSYIGPVLPTQGMAYEYCRQGLLETNVERLKALYHPRLRATLSALAEHLDGASWSEPEGGFFVGVTLPEGVHIGDLLARAGEAGLKISDGRAFFPRPADGDRFLRIPFCSLSPPQIQEAVARLARLCASDPG
jgi:DNA-binding transcriptional MocR family regulator